MLRVLVCIPHFYRRASDAQLGSSTDPPRRRAAIIEMVLRRIVALLAPPHLILETSGRSAAVLDTVDETPSGISGDIWICVDKDAHLLPASLPLPIRLHQASGDPLLLGIECRRIFAEHIGKYDLYCYVEDDVTIADPDFFAKYGRVYELLGDGRAIIPSRFEMGYVPYATRRIYLGETHSVQQLAMPWNDKPTLEIDHLGRTVAFVQTRTAQGGCYVLTDKQMRQWRTQNDFLEYRAIANLNPMETHQIPLGGRLPIYKPARENLSFLEVHHLGARFMLAKTAGSRLQALLARAWGTDARLTAI